MRANSQAFGFISAIAGATLWGFSGACSQFLFDHYEITSQFMTMTRALGAGIILLALIVVREREMLRKLLTDARQRARLALFGVALFGSQFFYVTTVSLTNAGTATVLQLSYMIFVLAFTTFIARVKPTGRQLLSFLCAVAGVWLIATQGNPAVMTLPIAGLLSGLVNGLAVAVYVISPKPLFERYGSFVVTGAGMMINGLFSTLVWALSQVAAPPAQAWALPSLDATGILVLIGGVCVLGTVVAFALYLHGVAVVGSVTGGLLGAFEPLGAMVISALWLGQAFSGADWGGFLLMMIMLVLLTVPAHKGR